MRRSKLSCRANATSCSTRAIAVLLDRTLADVAVVRDRIAAVFDLHMRAILSARLQIVLEGAPR